MFSGDQKAVEARYGRKLDQKCPLWAWISRYAGNQLTKYRVYSDGRTSIQRLTGRKWGRPLLKFGERILVIRAKGVADRRASIESRMVPGIYVGHHGRSGALIVLTEHGGIKARSFRRLPEIERFVSAELDKVKGVPWDMKGQVDSPMVEG